MAPLTGPSEQMMAETVDQLTKAINAKLQTLKLTQGQAITAIENKAVIPMERVQNTLKKKVEEVHDLKTEMQELMFEAEKEEHEIVKQSTEIREPVSVFEETTDQLDLTIKECKCITAQTEEKKRWSMTHSSGRKKYEEMRFEKAKLEQKQKYERKIEEKKEQNINAKLPKLIITQFKGTPADWLWFWVQFTAEIEADVSQITKFSYLKELLEPQVQPSIDGLPLTTEGYERVKNILKTKFVKESKSVNAYVDSIMSLPVIYGANQTRCCISMKNYAQVFKHLKRWANLGR